MRKHNILHHILLGLLLCSTGAIPAEQKLEMDLSLCIETGLMNNLKLQNKAIDSDIAEAGVSAAEGVYDSFMSLGTSYKDTQIPEPGSFLGGHNKYTTASAQLGKNLPGGTRITLSAEHNKYVIPGNEFIVIPPYSSSISLSVSQSLLRNAFGSLDRTRVEFAEYAQLISENIYMREKDLLALQISEAYWDLYSARANLDVGRQSLTLAKELLALNWQKEKDGLLDQTDVLASEAAIATRNVELLVLSNNVETASDYLLRIIMVPMEQRTSVSFKFPEANMMFTEQKESPADVNPAAFTTALNNRQDVAALRQSIDRTLTDLRIKKNTMRPDLNLVGSVSRGDTDISRDTSLEVGEEAWMIGIKLETSLEKKREKSDIRISELALHKAKNDLKDLEDAVLMECRTAARDLESAQMRISATRLAMQLQKERLRQEIDKFGQGRTDTRWVIQVQDDLAYSQMHYHVALGQYRKARAGYRVSMGAKPETGAE